MELEFAKATNSTIQYLSRIDIAIAFDAKYLQHFFALAQSIFDNNKSSAVHLHLIATGVPMEDLALIRSLCQTNSSALTIYNLQEGQLSDLNISGNWSVAAYYRIFFPLLVPIEVTRLLYLDTDTLVVGNLSPLFVMDMENLPVAAVFDNYVRKQPLIGIHDEGVYFNSGVLLIDIAIWKDRNITQRVLDYTRTHPERILFVDQCGLNAILQGQWLRLHPRFNALHSYFRHPVPQSDLPRVLEELVVIHFTLQRPWLMLSQSSFRKLYAFYGKRSQYPRFRAITDFSILKVAELIKLRLLEMYLSSPFLRKVWQSVKGSVSAKDIVSNNVPSGELLYPKVR